jgi:hypothetical protein
VVNGRTITYAVHYGETATIGVTSDGGPNVAALTLSGGGAVLILGLLIAGLVIRTRRRSKRPAPFMATSPDAPTITG